MNLHQLILTKNDCYKAGKNLKPLGLMLHSTGANNTKLSRYVGPDDGLLGSNPYNNHWNQPRPDGRQVCVHGFIGKLKDGSIATYQTLPWTVRGWHAGGTANNTHIGVEICEDGLTDSTYFNSVYKEAVDLFAYLCKQYSLNPLTQIICHAEGYQEGIASNHGDVLYWFKKHGKTMDDFRKAVKAQMDNPKESEEDEVRYKYYEDLPEYAKPTIQKLVHKGFLKGESDGVINLSDDMARMFVINDRAGLYD